MNGTWLRRPQSTLSVVFVHGILSSGQRCWRHENGTYWPDLVAMDSGLVSAGIYVFEYKTGFFSGTYSLGDVVDALRTYLRLDGVQSSQQLVFVCHSMGGIIARRYLVQNQLELVSARKQIGLFLIASPSLGSAYANWLSPLARLFDHTQADALRFAQNNTWLNDLDNDFVKLKDSGQISIRGKEIVEDKFVLPSLTNKQVVEPFAGRRYFDDGLKIPNSDHFSISTVLDETALQHKLLVEFIESFLPAGVKHAAPADNTCRIRFADAISADLVACQLAIDRIAASNSPIEIQWPDLVGDYSTILTNLIIEAAEHYKPTSPFHGRAAMEVADFTSRARLALQEVERIRAGAGERSKLLVKSMLEYWTMGLDNIIARALANFLTLANHSMVYQTLNLFRDVTLYPSYFPQEYETWFSSRASKDSYRQIFGIDEPLCSAKLSQLSGRQLEPYVYFWGPTSEVLYSANWRPGMPIRGNWFDKYLIPQNELRLIGTQETFQYDETLEIIKVIDETGKEIG